MHITTFAALAILLLIAPGYHAVAAQVSNAPATAPPRCDYILETNEKAQDYSAPVPPLWIANGKEGTLNMQRLAELGAPILWFSPREFLLLESSAPASAPPLASPADKMAAKVYFRIREVRLKRPSKGEPTIQLDGADSVKALARIRNVKRSSWGCEGKLLPIGELDQVVIRYFFYYREDRGIWGHPHDVEALELRLRAKPVCVEEAGATKCFHAVHLETASASAHGVGWYTNVLRVSSTLDTQIPLTVLVEENKHASSPDRDGDGLHMPHYDINQFSNDGWGIRDIAGTGKLGSPAYSGDQSRVLRALYPTVRALPRAEYWSGRLRRNFRRAEAAAQRPDDAGWRYTLETANSNTFCAANGTVNGRLVNTTDVKKFVELTTKLGFCNDPGATRVYPWTIRRTQWIADAASIVYPGPRNQYGFMSWPQRMSPAYRHDRGHGMSYVGPFLPGFEMPIFGGWLVSKVNVSFENLRNWNLGAVSTEGMYTPSASQSATWYVAIGHEWRFFDGKNAGQQDDHPLIDQTKGVAEEVGFKFRFSFEKFKIFRFYGARIGVRALGLNPVRDPRLIFEVGAGSW